MKLLIPLTLCFLLASSALGGQPSVRVIYFTPRGIRPPTHEAIKQKEQAMIEIQEFYKNQMRNHKSKTFKLERDANNRVKMFGINGEQSLEKYSLRSIANELDRVLGDGFSKDGGEIRVVFIAGIEFLTKEDHAVYLSFCSEQGIKLEHDEFVCKYYCLIPAESTKLSHITAHEIGHAFGLDHNPNGKEFVMYKDAVNKSFNHTRLSVDEARWLDCHRFFNNQASVKSVPIITKIHAPKWVRVGLKIYRQFRFDIENTFPLHQAYLVRKGDDVVLDYDYISEESTATFNVKAHHFLTRDAKVSILDTRSNYVHYDINLSDPPAAPSLFIPQTVVGTWGDIKANR